MPLLLDANRVHQNNLVIITKWDVGRPYDMFKLECGCVTGLFGNMPIAICGLDPYNAFAMDMQFKYEEGDHLEPVTERWQDGTCFLVVLPWYLFGMDADGLLN